MRTINKVFSVLAVGGVVLLGACTPEEDHQVDYNLAAPSVAFDDTSIDVIEGETVDIDLSTLGQPSTDINVSYSIAGTAVPGEAEDYEPLSGTVVVPSGLKSTSISITTVDNDIMDGTRTVELTLSGADNGFNVGNTQGSTVVTITIHDEEKMVMLDHPGTHEVMETAGMIEIPVSVSNPSMGDVSIHYSLMPSADFMEGEDYNLLSPNPLVLSDTTMGMIQIEIIDNVEDNDNSIEIMLDAVMPENGEAVIDEGTNMATYMIMDDYRYVNIYAGLEDDDLEKEIVWVTEGETDKVNLTVNLSERSGYSMDVQHMFLYDGDTLIPAPITFSPQQANAFVEVNIIDDDQANDTTYIDVVLSSVASMDEEIMLGDKMRMTVGILDND